jgi:hypothetical protein
MAIFVDERFKVDVEGEGHRKLFLGIRKFQDILRFDNRFDFHSFFFCDISDFIDRRDISWIGSVRGECDGAWLVSTAIGEVAVEPVLTGEAMQAVGTNVDLVAAMTGS